MKFATMATGGIGGFLAVRLTRAGHQVATIARGDHLKAIRTHGLRFESPTDEAVVKPWIATNDPSEVEDVDAIFFGVKGDGLEHAAELCKLMLGPATVVIPFLNGVEAANRLARILPPENVANGLAQISTTIARPGLIRQTGEFARFVFAERDSRHSDRIERIREALEAAGVSAPPTDDIERDVWLKFVLFSAMSGVTAASRCSLGQIRETEPLSDLFRTVLSETAALARARGVAIPEDAEAQIWETVQGLPSTMRASTAIDLESGRPLEIDWVSGAVKRLAAASGVDAPMNTALYALLSPHKDGTE
jgi:2-dehydropantoate 2-reductase